MNSVYIIPNDNIDLINNRKLYTSAGEECINSNILKCGKDISSVPVVNDILAITGLLDVLPLKQVGVVVPIHKRDDTLSVNNCRPISLTRVSCKLLKHLIHSKLVSFLEQHYFFSPHHHSFRKGYPC